MGKRIFIISKFIKRTKGVNKFHFNGHYRGYKIKEVHVLEGSFIIGDEYILAIDEVGIESGHLIGRLVKSRELFT